MLISCPSGLTFQARKWKIGDRRVLSDKKIVRQGLVLRKMLEAADEGLENPGPYPFEVGKKIDWTKVCMSDLISALLSIRAATRSELSYPELCDDPTCAKKFQVDIDLSKIEHSGMSEDAKQFLATGEPIAREVPLGDTVLNVKFKLLLGADMTSIARSQAQEPDAISEIQTCMHIAELRTPDGVELKKFRDIRKFFVEESWDFQEDIEDIINDIEGGVSTTVETECEHCGEIQESIIPFGIDFFYPRKRKLKSSMVIR